MEQVWQLDPTWTFLNHGSFGARLKVVANEQDRWRAQLESQPLRFMLDEYLPAIDKVRSVLADFVGAQAGDVVLVPNATYGVNSVLRSWSLRPGDEVLVLDQAYGACRAALNHLAHENGARVVEARLPLPIQRSSDVVDAVLQCVTPRTRFALLDAVSSPTGWVLPINELVDQLKAFGVETLVDAAHSPGLVPLDLDRCGAAFTAANLHKWVCAPLGSAFLHVRSDWRDRIFPCSLSHGLNLPVDERWQDCFDWTGTFDPSAWLSIPYALKALASCHPQGLDGLMQRNRQLARFAAQQVHEHLGYEPTAPESMFAAMTSLFLPLPPCEGLHHLATDPLQRRLIQNHRIEVPVISFSGRRLLRISCQHYTDKAQIERLVQALASEVPSMT